jgi:hypothetical protein
MDSMDGKTGKIYATKLVTVSAKSSACIHKESPPDSTAKNSGLLSINFEEVSF